ncbi:MAG: hypothetical protein ISS49_12705 [Anaerolineae bacterium]|nr:hypothetical protein [Anaerolineae bacterium]
MNFAGGFTTGHFYGRANLLAFLAQDAVCTVGFVNKVTATSYDIRNPRVWQKVSGTELADRVYDQNIKNLLQVSPAHRKVTGW